MGLPCLELPEPGGILTELTGFPEINLLVQLFKGEPTVVRMLWNGETSDS